MFKRIVVLIISSLVTVSCKNSGKTIIEDTVAVNQKVSEKHPGKKLMEANCYVCHNPTTSHDDRIAPPMIAVKEHYISAETTKEQFIADIQNWIKKPSEDKSKMPGAIRNFGLMPYAPYPDSTIKQIADYMFDNDIDQPEWFEDHFNQERGKGMGRGNSRGQGMGKGRMMRIGQTANEDSNTDYADKGLNYVLTTKAQLGKNLLGTIQKKGTKEAVTFCNERAYALTDSMANVNKAFIKRVSDKPRNQNNKANAVELAHIETFKSIIANKQEVEAIVEETGNTVNFYYPITTNTMCLQCHGTPNKELKSDTYKTIIGLYPKDEATGYGENEVRGIWSINFDK